MLRHDIAKALREARVDKGMTQVELAKIMRVQQPKVAYYEKQGPGSLAALERHCEALGLIFDWTIIDPEEMLNDGLETFADGSRGIRIPIGQHEAQNPKVIEPTTVSMEEPRDLGELVKEQSDEPRVEPLDT